MYLENSKQLTVWNGQGSFNSLVTNRWCCRHYCHNPWNRWHV